MENDLVSTIGLFCDCQDYDAWLCPDCKRLYVFEGGCSKPKYTFVPDPGVSRDEGPA